MYPVDAHFTLHPGLPPLKRARSGISAASSSSDELFSVAQQPEVTGQSVTWVQSDVTDQVATLDQPEAAVHLQYLAWDGSGWWILLLCPGPHDTYLNLCCKLINSGTIMWPP